MPPLKEHRLPSSPIDVRHYAIEVTLDPSTRSFEGVTRIDFVARTRIESFDLELLGLQVVEVEDATGHPLQVDHQDPKLTIVLAKPLERGEEGSITVRYGGVPRLGLWFSGDDGRGNPNQVFSQGQADESRGWFPCFDHPSDRVTSEVAVTLPAHWTSVAAGTLVSEVHHGEQRTDHWRMETSHPCYLVTLVAGDFKEERDESGGTDLRYVAERHLAPYLDTIRDETPAILDFLSDYTGRPYPYAKYSQAFVDNFPWGGMENISATTMTPLALTDERGMRDDDSIDLYVHEAAHQWFGDLITCNDWSHSWLNEGFASYAECLWLEHTEGYGAFRSAVRQYQESYLEHALADSQATISSLYREPGDLFDGDIYDGACVRLDQLRFLLGDDVFQACVRAYVAEYEEHNVVTDDLRRAFERVSGQRLAWFFEQWFDRPGFPQFDLQWSWDEERGVVELRVAQVQQRLGGVPDVYRTEVDVEVRDATGPSIHRVTIDERVEVFEMPTGGAPLYVRFDKGSWLPKAVRWYKSTEEWIALAELDDDPTGRVDAARALGTIAAAAGRDHEEHSVCVAVLARLLDSDEEEWVRAVAAKSLGKAGGSEARARLMQAASEDSLAGVREAALGALTEWGVDRDLAAFADAMYSEGYSYATMGAAALLRATSDPAHVFDWIAPKLKAESPHDVLRRRLLVALAWVDDDRVLKEAWSWAADRDTAPTARASAVARLGESDVRALEIARFLGELLTEPHYRLRNACVEALGELDNPESRRILRAYYAHAQDGGQRRIIEEALARTP